MAVFHPDIHGMSHGMCQLSVLVHWNTTTTIIHTFFVYFLFWRHLRVIIWHFQSILHKALNSF